MDGDKELDLVRSQTETICLKTLQQINSDLPYETQLKKVCSEIESATSVEHCFLFNKHSQVLLCERDGSSVLIELRPDDTMSSLIARKQPLIINDV